MTQNHTAIHGLDNHIPNPEMDLQSLPPFLRVLLTTDGTVTKSLEAFFWEPVGVETLAQGMERLAEDDADLALPAGAAILHRQVQLVGRDSGHCYAAACSLVCVQSLPEPVRDGLEHGRVGIGELLRESGLDTYRKILRFGACTSAGEASVWREYLILRDARALIKIRETFPLVRFQ